MTRREFVGTSAASALSYSQVIGANERLRIGVIGCGGQATEHMRNLVKMRDTDNCDVIAVCDVFDKRAEQAASLTEVIKIRYSNAQDVANIVNTVLSNQVADLQVRVNGKGVVGDAVKRPFFLYRMLLGLLPF